MGSGSSTGGQTVQRPPGGNQFQTTYQASFGGSERPPTGNTRPDAPRTNTNFNNPRNLSSDPSLGPRAHTLAPEGGAPYYQQDPNRRASYHYPTQVYDAPQSSFPTSFTQQGVDVESQQYIEFLQDAFNQDTSRDVSLSRIMAAEEFLENMEDTDKRIETMAEVNDRASVYTQMTEALGIRGHLQDELLRILAMLAPNDPHLNSLAEFEGEYPKVVRCLRDLAEKDRALRALSSTRENPGGGEAASAIGSGIAPSLLRTMGEKVEEVNIVAAQTEPGSGSDRGQITERDLKVKHKVEEQSVSETFADKLLNRPTDDPNMINHLLQDHSMSMQALRNRQNAEREKIASKIKHYRQTLITNPNQAGTSTSTMPSHATAGRGTMTSNATSGRGTMTSNAASGAGTLITLPQPVKKSYAAEIQFGPDGQMKVISDKDKAAGVNGKKPVGKATVITQGKRTGSASSIDSRGKTKKKAGEELDSDDDLDAILAAATAAQTVPEKAKEDDFGDFDDTASEPYPSELVTNNIPSDKDLLSDDSDQDTSNLRKTFTEDMWENHKKMTQEDFKAMLNGFREQEDQRKKVREIEKGKHKTSLLAKMAAKKRNAQYENADEKSSPSEDEDDSQNNNEVSDDRGSPAADHEGQLQAFLNENDETSGVIKSMRGGERSRLDQKLREKIENKKRTDQERIDDLTSHIDEELSSNDALFLRELKKRRAAGEDIDELLRRHLAEAEAIRKRKFAERARLDEKLKELIGNKKRKDLEEMDDEVENELVELDEELMGVVMSRGGVSPGDVEELLRDHRRKQEQIIRSRAAENSRLEDKLKQKLQENRRHSLIQDGELTADELFEQLQTLQSTGELDQSMFQEKLKQYLTKQEDKLQEDRREHRRRLQEAKDKRDQEAADAAMTASTLVTDHKQKAKQIRVLREREKQALDQTLNAALKKKKREREISAMDENDF